MKRKILAVAMMVVMSASLVACGGKNDKPADSASNASSTKVEDVASNESSEDASNDASNGESVVEVENAGEKTSNSGTLGDVEVEEKLADSKIDMEKGLLNHAHSNEMGYTWAAPYKEGTSLEGYQANSIIWEKGFVDGVEGPIKVAFETQGDGTPRFYSTHLLPTIFYTQNVGSPNELDLSTDLFNKAFLYAEPIDSDFSDWDAYKVKFEDDIKSDLDTNSFYELVYSNDESICAIFESEEFDSPANTTMKGYIVYIANKSNGIFYGFAYQENEAMYDDNRAYKVVESFRFAPGLEIDN